MATMEAMRRRIESAEDLYSVVRVMKALAAANIRQYEKTVESLQIYTETISMGFQIAIRKADLQHVQMSVSTRNPRTAILVCGSDQGMCGSFNEQIVNHAIRSISEHSIDRESMKVIAIGLRVVGRLEDSKLSPDQFFSLPSSLGGITTAVQAVLEAIDRVQWKNGIERIFVFHHRPDSASTYHPQTIQMLPLDMKELQSLAGKKWESRSLPTYTMESRQLFSALVRNYLLSILYRAFAESLASENTSRLMSMQAAEKNIEEHLTKLQFTYHQKRQQIITEELLDIVAGFETMTSDG